MRARHAAAASIASNAYLMVSESHSAASAAFREPLLCSPANSSNRSRLVHYVPNMDSGTDPYPLVVVTTFCSGGLGSCLPWQGEYCQVFGLTLRFLRQDTHSTAPLS
jgi:hypothetical protein